MPCMCDTIELWLPQLGYTQTLVTNVASYCGYIGPQYSYVFIFQSSESAM